MSKTTARFQRCGIAGIFFKHWKDDQYFILDIITSVLVIVLIIGIASTFYNRQFVTRNPQQ